MQNYLINQSIAAARAGATVIHAGCIGEGGEMLLSLLREAGVDVSMIKTVNEKNGHAIIQVTKDAENSIFIYPGSNAMIDEEYVDAVLDVLDPSDIVLLQNETSSVEYVIKRAYEKGLKVMFNPSPIKENVTRIDLNMLSYIILNSVEAKMITGKDGKEALEEFKRCYPELKVILTLGSKGSVYMHGDELIFTPSFKAKAVDTTAAGDTFSGYLLSGITKGLDMTEAMRLASLASAIAVSRHGAAHSIPTLDEVMGSLSTMTPADYDVSVLS